MRHVSILSCRGKLSLSAAKSQDRVHERASLEFYVVFGSFLRQQKPLLGSWEASLPEAQRRNGDIPTILVELLVFVAVCFCLHWFYDIVYNQPSNHVS